MDIWTYSDEEGNVERVRADIVRKTCPYCRDNLSTPRRDHNVIKSVDEARFADLTVKCCPVCGWWLVSRFVTHTVGPCGTLSDSHRNDYGASGVLRNLSLTDQSVPLDAIRKYLTVRYDVRFHIDPAKMEAVVASVYADIGYTAVVVGRTGDGGIDVVLENSKGEHIGVQVKRRRGKIEAEAIRTFAGSLYLKNILSGIFVTTSQYTKGARDTAATSAARRIPIQLIDAQRFYDQLRIAQRAAYERIDDPSAPYAAAKLLLLHSYSTKSHFLG